MTKLAPDPCAGSGLAPRQPEEQAATPDQLAAEYASAWPWSALPRERRPKRPAEVGAPTGPFSPPSGMPSPELDDLRHRLEAAAPEIAAAFRRGESVVELARVYGTTPKMIDLILMQVARATRP